MGFFDKLANTAKKMAEEAKEAVQSMTAPPPIAVSQERVNEIAQKFKYTLKDNEKAIFAAQSVDFLATDQAVLVKTPNGEHNTIVYNGAWRFLVYFSKNYRYLRFTLEYEKFNGTVVVWDDVQMSVDEMKDLYKALIKTYLSGFGFEPGDDDTLYAIEGKWNVEAPFTRADTIYTAVERACDYTIPDASLFFMSNGSVDFFITTETIALDMSGLASYENGSPQFQVFWHKDKELYIEVWQKWQYIGFMVKGEWQIDPIKLYQSEIQDIVIALNQKFGNAITQEQFNKISAGEIGLAIYLTPNRQLTVEEKAPFN